MRGKIILIAIRSTFYIFCVSDKHLMNLRLYFIRTIILGYQSGKVNIWRFAYRLKSSIYFKNEDIQRKEQISQAIIVIMIIVTL